MATHRRVRLLPFTIVVAVLMLGVRVGDVWRTLASGAPYSAVSTVHAQDKKPDATPADAPKPSAAPVEAVKSEPGSAPVVAPGNPAAAAAATAAARGDTSGNEAQMEVLQHLGERRQELDRKAQALDEREALLQVTEARVTEKMTEMKAMRDQIQSLLKQADEQKSAQITSLVKIYEGMKPKDAARIFDELDMPVLLGVIQQMHEAKSSPIIATMDATKAKQLTTALAEKRAVPDAAQPPVPEPVPAGH